MIEARHRPWHPFRQPGLCGLRGTTWILLFLSAIITGLIFGFELKSDVNNATAPFKRALEDQTAMAPETNPLRVTLHQGKDGSFLCDPISISVGRDSNTDVTRNKYGRDLYFCSEQCAWSNVKAYYGDEQVESNPRFRAGIVKRDHKGIFNGKEMTRVFGRSRTRQYFWLLNITIANVQFSDAGKYYCVWALTGKDAYQEVQLNVIPPPPEITMKNIMADLFPDPNHVPQNFSSKDIEYIMGSDLSDNIKEVRTAKAKCNGNYACALALLQRDVVKDELDGDCWVCMQLHTAWRTQPLTSEMITNECVMPEQMSIIVRMSDNLKANQPIMFNLTNHYCSNPGLPFRGPTFHVQSHLAELCICSTSGTHFVGMSDCKNTVTINSTKRTGNCTLHTPGKGVKKFNCPFSHLDSAPGMMWTCGGIAHYHLDPGDWQGCCYPSLISTGTTILSGQGHEVLGTGTVKNRSKREVLSAARPDHYDGYRTANPWTSPWENVGWSLAGMLTGVGTTVALNKINGLAWQVLSLENDTTYAFQLIGDELKKMREAVIQHRLVLDMLTAEKGGLCKMLGISCCFNVPDNSGNLTDIIGHMRKAIPQPEKVSDSWFAWLDGLWGGWGTWIFTTVLPVMLLIVALLLIAPCLIQCLIGLITRTTKKMMSTTTYQTMVSITQPQRHFEYQNARTMVTTDPEVRSVNESEDSHDFVQTYVLERQDPEPIYDIPESDELPSAEEMIEIVRRLRVSTSNDVVETPL